MNKQILITIPCILLSTFALNAKEHNKTKNENKVEWLSKAQALIGEWHSTKLTGFSPDQVSFDFTFSSDGSVVSVQKDKRREGINVKKQPGKFAVGKEFLVVQGEFVHPETKKVHRSSGTFLYKLDGDKLILTMEGRIGNRVIELQRSKQ